ncbi:unnamed protein product [Euphydryas editha]|uniref:Uncharacterized protein n=1 Tax=Euphydryas editha TaxID=104508 RepID=A0AAU9V6N3_EUPED|nr:unnamed protein product [Euphydryas editha]
MITLKIVNFVALTILIFIFLCESCSSIDIIQNVRFVKPLSENYNQEQEQNVIPPKILFNFKSKWDHVNTLSDLYPSLSKDQEIESAEDGIRWENEKKSLDVLKNKGRFVRQVNNAYSTLYPALTTPYPNVKVNPTPYRPAASSYGTAPYNNFNTFPASYQNNFPNTTSRYPPYNAVSSRPPYYPPKQNLNNFNTTSFNQNLSQYNQSSYLYPNNLSSQTAQHNYFNNYPVSNQNYLPNTTSRYPPYNPVSSRPPYYHPPIQNLNNVNATSFYQNLSHYNQSSYLYPNNLLSQNNAMHQQNTHNYQNFQADSISAINRNYTSPRQPIYNPTFVPNNQWSTTPYSYNTNTLYNKNDSTNQITNSIMNNNQYNQYPSNYKPNSNLTSWRPTVSSKYNTSMNMYTSTKAPWLNDNLSNTPGYGYNPYQYNPQRNMTFNGSNLNFPSYNIGSTIQHNNYNRPYQNAPGSTRNISNFNIPSREPWSNNPVPWNPNNQSNTFNRGNYNNLNQWSTNNSSTPNQYNYREPNHFFYTPGQNPPSYDTSKISPENFS